MTNHPAQADEAKGMTDRQAFEAYWNEDCASWGPRDVAWFAWQAAINHERAALHPDGGNPQ